MKQPPDITIITYIFIYVKNGGGLYVMTLLNKIKKTITKYRKWIFPVGLGAILSLFLLGRRNKKTSSYDDLKKRQEDREEKAEHIIGIADDIEKETEQLINEFYKRRFERRD